MIYVILPNNPCRFVQLLGNIVKLLDQERWKRRKRVNNIPYQTTQN